MSILVSLARPGNPTSSKKQLGRGLLSLVVIDLAPIYHKEANNHCFRILSSETDPWSPLKNRGDLCAAEISQM